MQDKDSDAKILWRPERCLYSRTLEGHLKKAALVTELWFRRSQGGPYRGPHKTSRKWDGKGGAGSLNSVFSPWQPLCLPRGKFHPARLVLLILRT